MYEHSLVLGVSYQEDKVGRACETYGRGEKYVQLFGWT